MNSVTVPFDFHMDCFWANNPDSPECSNRSVSVDLTDEEFEAFQKADKKNLREACPDIYKKIDAAVNERCKALSYRYALIDLFSDNLNYYDEDERMMEVFAKEGLFDPEECYGGDDKEADFSIWLEEYFFDLDEEGMVEFIEKYYGHVAEELSPEKMEYGYEFKVE